MHCRREQHCVGDGVAKDEERRPTKDNCHSCVLILTIESHLIPNMSANIDPFKPVVIQATGDAGRRLELHVLPYGLTVHRLIVTSSSSKTKQHDVIVCPEAERDHHARGRNFLSPIVGRYANRLPAGKSTYVDAKRQGQQHSVDLPEWGGDDICHHGGPVMTSSDEPAAIPIGEVPMQKGPLDRLVWTLVNARDSQLFQKEVDSNSNSIACFALNSAAGSNGLPCDLRIEARFEVSPKGTHGEGKSSGGSDLGASNGTVRVEYRAQILSGTKGTAADVTPLNLTHHWGFNLSASDPEAAAKEQGRIDEHLLRMHSPQTSPLQRLELDPRGVPTGKLIPCPPGDSAGHGFSTEGSGKRIGESLPQGGYDHFYTWGPANTDAVVTALRAPSTGLALTFKTNQSGVQFYSANGQPVPSGPQNRVDAASSGGAKKKAHRHLPGESEDTANGIANRSAAFLEFSHPHATFLKPEFQEFIGGEDTLLRAGETYSNWCEIGVWAQ